MVREPHDPSCCHRRNLLSTGRPHSNEQASNATCTWVHVGYHAHGCHAQNKSVSSIHLFPLYIRAPHACIVYICVPPSWHMAMREYMGIADARTGACVCMRITVMCSAHTCAPCRGTSFASHTHTSPPHASSQSYLLTGTCVHAHAPHDLSLTQTSSHMSVHET